jgi:Spy/CpxP family protein refolding chaperone
MRFSKSGWVVAGLLIAAMATQTALAQREEGRRGRGPGGGMFGPPTASALMRAKEVQEALKLTDEQKDKVEKINDENREEMRKLFQDGGMDRDKMVEVAKKTSEQISEVLDDGQEKRLMGILIQVSGAAAVSDPSVAKELNITDDQKKKLQEVRMSAREQFQGFRDLSSEERGKKVAEVQADINKKILAELTADQQKQLDDLKGEKVEIDMSQLRGGPGGRGERGDRGERGERRGDRESKGNE